MKKKKALSPFEQKLNNWVTDHLSRVPFVQKMFFVEHLRTMIHAGISLVEGLGILQKELGNKKLQKITNQIKKEVEPRSIPKYLYQNGCCRRTLWEA